MKYLKFALHKRYFDTGMGITNYLKYVIALFGIASLNLKWTMILAVIYAFTSYIIGWYWLNSGLVDAEKEIDNRYNPFVREMRRVYGKVKI